MPSAFRRAQSFFDQKNNVKESCHSGCAKEFIGKARHVIYRQSVWVEAIDGYWTVVYVMEDPTLDWGSVLTYFNSNRHTLECMS